MQPMFLYLMDEVMSKISKQSHKISGNNGVMSMQITLF